MARLAEGVVALVFLAAGLLKAWDPPGFALAVARLQILPTSLVGAAAIVLPWLEMAAGAALLAGPAWRGAGRAIVVALLALFSAVLASALVRGVSASCGCFGVDGGFFARIDVGLARNLLLLALLAPALRRALPGRRGAGCEKAPGSPAPS